MSDDTHDGLAEKLAALAAGMGAAERANYKLLLAMAAGGLAQEGRPPTAWPQAAAFDTAVASIARLQPHHDRVNSSGVVYRGRPSFLTDDLLDALRGESDRLRSTAVRFDDHFVVSDAPLAREVAHSTQLSALIAQHTAPAAPTAKADYLYYDEVGFGIDPHVDNESFSLNVITMLEHVHTDQRSALVLYPPGSPPQRILLGPGELIVFYADSITHARERMGLGERLSIVAFGFQPLV